MLENDVSHSRIIYRGEGGDNGQLFIIYYPNGILPSAFSCMRTKEDIADADGWDEPIAQSVFSTTLQPVTPQPEVTDADAR